MVNALTPTQADREAADDFLGSWPKHSFADYIKPALTEAFARHRLNGFREGLEAAAVAMENLCFFTDIEEQLTMTKQQMSVKTCHEGAAAIRAINPTTIGDRK